ncbi:MAG: XTP/dITP diphosphatase [Chlamydiae bacterium]|nr:XTP/dITP diphosphatase [Chlamydiota bacterium]
MNIVLATKNLHKLREIQEIFQGLPFHFLSLAEFKDAPSVTEDGTSFEENAIKKAQSAASFTREISLADDSGLEVDALQEAPGIYSARFAGENATDEENNLKVLALLKNLPPEKRKARYRCVMALATPEKRVHITEGICEGLITKTPQGKNGFGYDPIFFYPPFGKTFGQTDPILKNKVSHRFQALENIKPFLNLYFSNPSFSQEQR